MNQKKLFLGLLSFSLLFSLISCEKENKKDNTQPETEIATHSDDESQFTAEVDAITNDANLLLEAGSSISPRNQDYVDVICDASVAVDLESNPRTITINYKGTKCWGNKTRNGIVVLSIAQGVDWKNAGAAITVDIQQVKITRVGDNKSITLNGKHTYTNVSGGLLINLASLKTVTHAVSSNDLSITFDSGAQRVWQVSQNRVFTYDNGAVATISGTHTQGIDSQVAVWGTNRFGNTFTSSITTPLVVRQDCDFRLTAGAIKHVLANVSATATFGLDVNGNPTSCPTGNYYYKLVWTGPNGNSFSAIVAY